MASPAAGRRGASFLESRPGPGATVGEARRLTLEYTEPLNERLSQATLVGVDGERKIASTVRATRGRRLAIVPRGTLGAGSLRIDWRAVSVIDGHIKEGSVSFGVGVPVSGAGLSLEKSPIAAGRWPRIVFRGVLYGGLLFFAGGVLLSALLTPKHRRPLALPAAGAGGARSHRRRPGGA